MRLIDGDELIKYIPAEEILSKLAVALAETVDAVEVVRCKDCRYYCHHEFFGKPYFTCDIANQYMTGDIIGVGFEPPEDWFCANGERREDE